MVNSLSQGIIRQGAQEEWSQSDENIQGLNNKCCKDTLPWQTDHPRSSYRVIYTSFIPLELHTVKGWDSLYTKQYDYSDILSFPIAPVFILFYFFFYIKGVLKPTDTFFFPNAVMFRNANQGNFFP